MGNAVAITNSFHIAIDVGSTSIKGALLDLETNGFSTVRSLPFPAPRNRLPSTRVEIEPEDVVVAVSELIRQLSVGCVGEGHVWICGQMGGVVLADTRGNALSPYYSWRDQRTVEVGPTGRSWMQMLREAWPEEVWASLGRELQPGSTSTLLYWLRQHELLPSRAIPCSIADFVVARLAHQAPTMHVTYAIGLLDLQQVDIHHDALQRIGLGDVTWGKLVHGLEPIAQARIDETNYEFHGCFGDHQTALWGAGLERSELSINVSTGSQVSQRTSSFEPGGYQSRLFFGGDWLNTVTHLPAGRALNALLHLCTELNSAEVVDLSEAWKSIAEKMAVISTTDMVADINFYASPLGTSGSFSNLTIENLTVGHLFLAACNAMAENYRVVANRLAGEESFRSIVLSGGLAQSLPRLADFIRDRFPMPVREVNGEDTLLGLLKLAHRFSAPSSTCS